MGPENTAKKQVNTLKIHKKPKWIVAKLRVHSTMLSGDADLMTRSLLSLFHKQ